ATVAAATVVDKDTALPLAPFSITPLTPEQSQRAFVLPAGYHMELVASEKPINRKRFMRTGFRLLFCKPKERITTNTTQRGQ
ncbi:MAG: hypothetical protein EOO39_14155, partial [Cytophagaceae bacterium]